MSLLTNLEAFLRLSGDALDSSGNAHHGTPTGITYGADGAVFSPGSSSKIAVASPINIAAMAAFSIGFRLKPASLGVGAQQDVFSNNSGAETAFGFTNTGSSRCLNANNYVFGGLSSTDVLTVGAPHVALFTRETSGPGGWCWYVDGVLVASGPFSAWQPFNGTAMQQLGQGAAGVHQLDASIQFFAVWSRALSGAEAAAWAASPDLFPPPPPAITSINPASGTELGGTEVTLTGTGFVDGATVTFGGVAATATEWDSATTMVAVTPPGTVGAADVVVTNPDAQAGTLAGGFAYLSSVTPPVFTKYGTMLEKLLPRGAVWDLEGDSELHALMLGAGDELKRIEDRGADLIEESDPRTATETITDWERMVGLPDDQVTVISAVIAERRVAVTQKLVGRTGQNLDFFQRLCRACGYPLISLERYTELISRVTETSIGDMLFGDAYAYAMLLTLDTPIAGALTETQFKAVIRKATHSHIQVVFVFT